MSIEIECGWTPVYGDHGSVELENGWFEVKGDNFSIRKEESPSSVVTYDLIEKISDEFRKHGYKVTITEFLHDGTKDVVVYDGT